MIKTKKKDSGRRNKQNTEKIVVTYVVQNIPQAFFVHTIIPGCTQVLQSKNIFKKLAKLQKSDTLILDSNLHAVKIYHMLQPSPAGNLWPTLYTLPPLRHTGGTGMQK